MVEERRRDRRRVNGNNGGMEPQRGMPKMGGVFSAPRMAELFLPGCGAQQRTVAAAHQSDTALDQADGQAAKIMILPGTAKNALLAEQALCDFTITMTRQPGIEGPHN